MPIRDTFWNIPHWAEIAQYILALVTVIVFIYGVSRHILRWRKGQPEKRSGHFWSRIWSVVTQVFGQRRTLDEAYAGIMHFTIFWGMLVLAIGTALATIDWDVTHLFFGFQILKGWVYILFELILDILGLMVVIGLGMAFYRRYVMRPARIREFPEKTFTRDDTYVLVMLAFIVVSGYLTEGLRVAVTQPTWAAWSPIGNLIASVFLALGDPTNRTLHLIIWTMHVLSAFIFLASLPFTKLFHIISLPLNIYFRSIQPAGALPPVRVDGGMGVKEWKQFTWKQLLDFEACTRCGRCQDVCPAYASTHMFSPRNMMVKLEAHLWEKANGHTLHGDVISAKELWACTTCRACTQVCPAFIDHVTALVDMRRHLVEQGDMDNLLQKALLNLGRYGNSFGQSERMRAKWTAGLQLPVRDARREAVEYLWFVGDYASYNTNLTDITRKTSEVFHKAGLNFGILFDMERNAGNDIRRVGEEGLFEMLVEKNSQALSKCQYKTIVTTDPHSYNTLKNEYPWNGHRPSILHTAELLDQLITAGQIKFSKKLNYKVTYHDPCYLGRYNGVYDAPRRIIEATGCQLVEMPRHGDRAFCCGAGGGRIWMEEKDIKERPSENRIREAVGLDGVAVFVVACPKDVTMFRDAVKTSGNESKLQVKDLIELVYEAI
ncbi:MAG TPA: heterodisulfide reductase-related iron-sulfur binding cluster [Anaerolineales bacterium]|nr:heterodisulfide reductase-related iron-sulfur binding cluster [Anaerolineales bacterium]